MVWWTCLHVRTRCSKMPCMFELLCSNMSGMFEHLVCVFQEGSELSKLGSCKMSEDPYSAIKINVFKKKPRSPFCEVRLTCDNPSRTPSCAAFSAVDETVAPRTAKMVRRTCSCVQISHRISRLVCRSAGSLCDTTQRPVTGVVKIVGPSAIDLIERALDFA